VTTGVWGWEPVCGSLGLGISFPWSLHSILYLYSPFFSLHFVLFLSVPFGTFFFKALYLLTLLAVVLDDDEDGLLRLTEDYGYI
jgi:hypothetical protein